jgi:hypothetical protein
LALTASLAAEPADAKSRPPARRANARTGLAPTPYDDLVKAVKHNDRGAIERVVGRLGPARLFEGLHNASSAVILAVLTAAPRARGGVSLAGSIADLTASPDPAISAAAARSVGDLLAGDVPSAVEEWEVPPDTLSHACGALHALALRPEAARPARLAALEATAESASTCGGTEDLAGLLKDPTPAIRRAAALVLQPSEKRSALGLRAASRDPDPGVAAAAVAVLCRAGGAGARRVGEPLALETVDLARALIVAPATPPDDAVEMINCLAAARTPADRKLLDQLRRGPPSQLRDGAAEMADALDAAKPQ